jgi:hypothetical protein
MSLRKFDGWKLPEITEDVSAIIGRISPYEISLETMEKIKTFTENTKEIEDGTE